MTMVTSELTDRIFADLITTISDDNLTLASRDNLNTLAGLLDGAMFDALFDVLIEQHATWKDHIDCMLWQPRDGIYKYLINRREALRQGSKQA